MTRTSARIVASLCLLVASVPAFAFQPFITDDTGTQGDGGNQIELSITRDRAVVPDDTATTRTWGAVFTRGFTDALDVFVQANHSSTYSSGAGTSVSGAGNPSFGAKWRFHEDADKGLSFALKPELFVPVDAGRENDGLGRGRTSFGTTLIATQEVSFGALHANIFVGRDRYRDAAANPDTTIARYSLAPVWEASARWTLGLDLGTETASAGGARTRTNFTGIGAVYSPDKNLDVALGLMHYVDVNGEARTNSLTAGVTCRF